MNTAGIYRLDPCFLDLLRTVRREFPRAPPDAMLHAFLHEPERFRNFQRYGHKFHYSDLIQNWLSEWSEEMVLAHSPNTVLVHGKYRT